MSLSLSQRLGPSLVPFALILLACGLWPEMELLVPSLPDLKDFFLVSDGQIQQLLTVNFIGFLIGVLFAGPLCDSLGRKKILIAGAIGYLLASFFCTTTSSFEMLMVGRFFQGLFMTGPAIAGGVILMESTSGPNQIFWMSLSNSIITLSMAAGPILGAYVNQIFGFKGNLLCIFIIGLVGSIPAFYIAPETLTHEKKKPFEPKKLFHGYLTLMKDLRFMTLSSALCSLAAAYWIYVGVSALYMVDHLGLPASSFGIYQGPIVGAFSLISLTASWFLKRFTLKRSIFFGKTLMLIGLLPLFILNLMGIENGVATTVCMMVFVGGMALPCSVLFPYSMAHLPPELQGNAHSLLNAIRLFLASIGTFILGFVYEGPLLPVTSILLVILSFSLLILHKSSRFFEAPLDPHQQVIAGH